MTRRGPRSLNNNGRDGGNYASPTSHRWGRHPMSGESDLLYTPACSYLEVPGSTDQLDILEDLTGEIGFNSAKLGLYRSGRAVVGLLPKAPVSQGRSIIGDIVCLFVLLIPKRTTRVLAISFPVSGQGESEPKEPGSTSPLLPNLRTSSQKHLDRGFKPCSRPSH